MSTKSRDQIWKEWTELVNMTPKELDTWLATDESRSVGVAEGGGEAIGHKSGRAIVEIRRTRKGELNESHWDHMAKVIGYIRRHCAQGPSDDVEHSRWRYSLMNWGHDPLKDDGCA